MLEVRSLAVRYGQHPALKGVDLTVAPGEIVVILGANGAGKSSLLKALAGMLGGAASGAVTLGGQALSGLAPHRIVEAGLALVPEGRGIFGDLSVQENLALGAFARRAREGQAQTLQRVLALFPRLAERQAQMARTMSGGEQQMVAIGRALMSSPTILMLDEPSLGLSPRLSGELFRNLQAVRASGVGILLVEQNARQSLAIADRAYLLENGRIVGQGPARAMLDDPAVQAAYLGGAASASPVKPQPGAPAAAPKPPTPTIATTPTDPGPTPRVAPAPSSSVAADTLVPTRITDLVRLATQRQADDVLQQRGPQPAFSTASGVFGSGPDISLDNLLADIERAAQRARLAPSPMDDKGGDRSGVHGGGSSGWAGRTTQPEAGCSGSSVTGTSPSATPPEPPRIEVWRRPGLEIHRRGSDGTWTRAQ
jgi:branched-chain amino acid transport system ATP-binding protein